MDIIPLRKGRERASVAPVLYAITRFTWALAFTMGLSEATFNRVIFM